MSSRKKRGRFRDSGTINVKQFEKMEAELVKEFGQVMSEVVNIYEEETIGPASSITTNASH